MDYKVVIEEQIEKLQSVQDEVSKSGNKTGYAIEACRVAETISNLITQAVALKKT